MPVLMKAIPATEKCFLDESIHDKPLMTHASCLRGEEFHFFMAYTADDPQYSPKVSLTLDTESVLPITVESVSHVPVRMPCYPGNPDENYLRKTPGLFPDLLQPLKNGDRVFAAYNQLHTLFITVKIPETAAAGDYPVQVRLLWEDTVFAESTVTLHVIPAVLPKQTLKVTQWFHCDCIASYYELEIFSEKHWAYIENFLRTAVENGINTILTPVFTPPLDTAVGGERPTVQLVDVEKTSDGNWIFGFDKLERWIEICNRVGVEFFEISHLFTQWGAGHAPKIVGKVNGKLQKIFGWDTDSLSDEYRTFLRSFLTALLAKLRSLNGADKRCLFHISDEPSFDHLEQYKAAKASIIDLLEGYPIMDALSDFEFYKTGAVTNPIPASSHIEPFLDANVPDLWVYYCCGQGVHVSNRFLAMPMARTRIMGLQMWKYNIIGFLQWGYNFWYSQFSVEEINPFEITDGNYFYPAGDGYSVYPGKNGKPLSSLHLKAFTAGLNDMRALQLAETLCGREAVLAAVEGDLETEITFFVYPHEGAWLMGLREKINAMIEAAL